MTDNSLPQHSPAMRAALDWLAVPSGEDVLEDIIPLRLHLRGVVDTGLMPLHLLKVLELIEVRAKAVTEVAHSLLLDATVPVPKRLRSIAQALGEIHGLLAQAYLQIVNNAEIAQLARPRRNAPLLCANGLEHALQQLEISLLVSSGSPQDLWSTSQALFHRAHEPSSFEDTLPGDPAVVDLPFKRMLALISAQPETFTPREVVFLRRAIAETAGTVDLSYAVPPTPAHDWYWLEPGRDMAPVPFVRRLPAGSHTLLFHSCAALGRQIEELLAQLDANIAPSALGLPDEAAQTDFRNVLRRAAENWITPPKRQHHRRHQPYRVEVCANIGRLWQVLHGDQDSASSTAQIGSDWMVINESPSGLAMMHVSGEVTGILPGSAVGLRIKPDEAWSVCLVRWARSDNPEHVELGLDLLAPETHPVRILAQPTNGGTVPEPVPALLLPSLPHLARGEALLTPRGGYVEGKFALVDDAMNRVGVVTCVSTSLDLQTSSIEVFQFQRDNTPSWR
ncbi:MAG: hypothetical protein EG825_01110 [Rhodocyclaceae bacterium]|nr:hypothetical protein [Rhodocyclaceae bacterium]